MSFDKGDRLEIIDRPPTDPEWFKARNQKGQIGLVPRNYLQELQEYLNTPYRGGPDSLDRRPEMPASATSTMQSSHGPNGVSSQPERPILSGKSWYYGAITRSQCDTVLNSHGHDGDFLIRDSETNVSIFSVSRSAYSLFYCLFISFYALRLEIFLYHLKRPAEINIFGFMLKATCTALDKENSTIWINLSIITKELPYTQTSRAKNSI